MGKGKKSKKRGGKATSSAPSSSSGDKTKDEMKMDKKTRGEEMKEWRDNMADILSKEEHTKDLSEDEIQAAQFIMAMNTKLMAECGIVEEEKHSSLTYVEEHADKVFVDGGARFFEQLSMARIDAIMKDPVKQAEMDKLKNEGDTEGCLRLMQIQQQAIDKERDAMRAREGLPPEIEEDLFIGTLVDDDLFAPPPPREDCSICFLPLPTSHTYQPCCGKNLCDGCIHAHRVSAVEYNCPFCRTPVKATKKEKIKMLEKRLEVNDSGAHYMMGAHYLQGSMGMKKDMGKAIEHFAKAAELGLGAAHHNLACFYADGIGVKRDEKKSMHHLRLAAIGGMLESRYTLGTRAYAAENQNMELATKHWLIAAEAGHDASLKAIKLSYSDGHVTKDLFAKALRAHKAANDELKSDQRDTAAKFHRENAGYEETRASEMFGPKGKTKG